MPQGGPSGGNLNGSGGMKKKMTRGQHKARIHKYRSTCSGLCVHGRKKKRCKDCRDLADEPAEAAAPPAYTVIAPSADSQQRWRAVEEHRRRTPIQGGSGALGGSMASDVREARLQYLEAQDRERREKEQAARLAAESPAERQERARRAAVAAVEEVLFGEETSSVGGGSDSDEEENAAENEAEPDKERVTALLNLLAERLVSQEGNHMEGIDCQPDVESSIDQGVN